jgi:TMEM175 potassium channel family protein
MGDAIRVEGRKLAGEEGRGDGMDAANEQTQGASAEKLGETRSVEKSSAGNEIEYATIEAAEIAQTLEKDRRMLVFGEDRLLFLADAVFAIAMTLLVLEVSFPVGTHLDEGHFNEALGTLIAQTLSYLITFAVLARYWIAHRSLMRLVDRLDTPAIWLTFLFLVFVAFFPVPSGILGDYDYTGAVVFFTLALVGCGYSLLAIWLYVSGKNRLLGAHISRRAIADRSVDLASAPTVLAAGGPAGMVHPVPAAAPRHTRPAEWRCRRHGRVIGSRVMMARAERWRLHSRLGQP